jgi:hypothetical protein
MGKICSICGERTIFFVWGSSRNIKVIASKLIMKFHSRELDSMDVFCCNCCKKYDLLEERPPLDINKPRKYRTWDECY